MLLTMESKTAAHHKLETLIVGVKDVWNAADFPVRITFSPDPLPQGQGRSQ